MFNFVFFSFLVTVLFLLIFCIFDIKYREVPNYLVFLFFGIGLLANLIISFWLWEFSYIFNSLLSFGITFVLTFVLWELGLFAGGDLKIFVALAVLNPLNLNFFRSTLSFGIIKQPIFGITMVIASVFSVLPYVLLFTTYKIITKNYFKTIFSAYFSKSNLITILNSIVVLFLITSFMNVFSLKTPLILLLLLSLVLVFLFSNVHTYSKKLFYYSIIFLYLVLFVSTSFIWSTQTPFLISNLFSIILSILIIYLFILFYRVTKDKVLVQEKEIHDLKEGDVSLFNYYLINKKIVSKKSTFLSAIKEMLLGKYYDNLMIDSRKAGGLTKKEVTFLNESYDNRLVGNTLKVKVTIPFTPAVLIAYILLNIFGDVIWLIL